MPVTVVVGGQYGSEGKGKVTHWLARKQRAAYAIRVGGPNSGHTAVEKGRPVVLRQLPTPALCGDVVAIIPAGAYVRVDVLLREIEQLRLSSDQLWIHPAAVIINDSMRADEREAGLLEAIASTGQGVGSAVARRTMRQSSMVFAGDTISLRPYVRFDLQSLLADALSKQERILVEGTQGFGLSILHGGDYPYATSRDTSASGALSEAGLSPRDVDCVALTLRAFPIRVGGNSGPLPVETSWDEISRRSGAHEDLTEYTTVTGRRRRVARFDVDVVSRAISVNRPDTVFLNHVDYFDYAVHERAYLSCQAMEKVHEIESMLGQEVGHVGVGPAGIIHRPIGGWLGQHRADEALATAG